jgi:hypothetical protein
MTEDKTYTWIKDATYTTRDGTKAICNNSWEDGAACFRNPITNQAWMVDKHGRSALRLGWADIAEDLEQELTQLENQLEQDARAGIDHWQDGYREAIKDAICAIVMDGTMNRHMLVHYIRSLLNLYDKPSSDPPF